MQVYKQKRNFRSGGGRSNKKGLAYFCALLERPPVNRTEENTAMSADIDYVGILNLLRQLVEKGAITKAESRKIAGYLAKSTKIWLWP